MAKTNEYLERRCVITELVLHDLGELIAAHLPGLQPQLQRIGAGWSEAIRALDADIPDEPN